MNVIAFIAIKYKDINIPFLDKLKKGQLKMRKTIISLALVLSLLLINKPKIMHAEDNANTSAKEIFATNVAPMPEKEVTNLQENNLLTSGERESATSTDPKATTSFALNKSQTVNAKLDNNIWTISGSGKIDKSLWSKFKQEVLYCLSEKEFEALSNKIWSEAGDDEEKQQKAHEEEDKIDEIMYGNMNFTLKITKDVQFPDDAYCFFAYWPGLIDLDPEIDTSNVYNMAFMFAKAKKANPNVANWNTANVKNIMAMFYGAEQATPDVSKWNTSKVHSMAYMFAEALIANPDVSNWDTASVTDMKYLFARAVQANPDVSNWNTANVTDMSHLFEVAMSANPDVSNWNTSKVTDLNSMFFEASSANPDFSKWDIRNVTNIYSFFYLTKENALEKLELHNIPANLLTAAGKTNEPGTGAYTFNWDNFPPYVIRSDNHNVNAKTKLQKVHLSSQHELFVGALTLASNFRVKVKKALNGDWEYFDNNIYAANTYATNIKGYEILLEAAEGTVEPSSLTHNKLRLGPTNIIMSRLEPNLTEGLEAAPDSSSQANSIIVVPSKDGVEEIYDFTIKRAKLGRVAKTGEVKTNSLFSLSLLSILFASIIWVKQVTNK